MAMSGPFKGGGKASAREKKLALGFLVCLLVFMLYEKHQLSVRARGAGHPRHREHHQDDHHTHQDQEAAHHATKKRTHRDDAAGEDPNTAGVVPSTTTDDKEKNKSGHHHHSKKKKKSASGEEKEKETKPAQGEEAADTEVPTHKKKHRHHRRHAEDDATEKPAAEDDDNHKEKVDDDAGEDHRHHKKHKHKHHHQQRDDEEKPEAGEEDGADPAAAQVGEHHLDINVPAKDKAVCPLPVLHPEKWQKKMHWGERKEFPRCGRSPDKRFSTLIDSIDTKKSKKKHAAEHDGDFDNVELDPHKDKATLRIDRCRKPKSQISAYGFKELLDTHFTRLSSTIDAETRQNDLKQHFSMDRIREFGKALTITKITHKNENDNDDDGVGDDDDNGDGSVTKYTATLDADTPYVIAACGEEHELHVRSLPLAVQHPKGGHKQWSRRMKLAKSSGAKTHGGEDGGEEVKPRIHTTLAPSGETIDERKPAQIKNMLHVMVDSTSLYALRRDGKKMIEWMNKLNNQKKHSTKHHEGEEDKDEGKTHQGGSYVYPFKHFHAVSCCSPGNQIPVYSGNLNGEGDHFVKSEPHKESKDWMWNIAAKLGYKTFWSLDNCPDKSARDYHAYPSVDERVVAPLCLAGVLLSHKDQTCLAGKTVDQHVISGLESFWARNEHHSKFAAVQFITPHEESEKLLIELDIQLEIFFKRLESSGILEDTAVFFWSDHGINFGKYASTHDGEIEKMYPFANVILPRWWVEQSEETKRIHHNLRSNQDKLVTPYDFYEVVRDLLYFPEKPPLFRHDKENPPLPKPSQSHIIASFQKDILPMDLMRSDLSENRDCWAANIPMEFCTCIQWKSTKEKMYTPLIKKALRHHKFLLQQHGGKNAAVVVPAPPKKDKNGRDLPPTEDHQDADEDTPLDSAEDLEAKCEPVVLDPDFEPLVEVQKWPTEYKPKEQFNAKSIWMKPNRDMVKVQYRTKKSSEGAEHGGGLFEAAFSISKEDPTGDGGVDLAHLDRLDGMQRKCGIVQKQVEHLCICKDSVGENVN